MKVELLRWNIYVNPDVMYKIMMALRQVLCNKKWSFTSSNLTGHSCVRACMHARACACGVNGRVYLYWVPHFFSSTKNSGLHFQRMELHFSEFPEKRTTLRGIPQFSDICNREIVFHFTCFLEFTEFSFEWFVFSEIQQFSDFLEALPRFEIHWLKFCSWNTLIGQWTELWRRKERFRKNWAFL